MILTSIQAAVPVSQVLCVHLPHLPYTSPPITLLLLQEIFRKPQCHTHQGAPTHAQPTTAVVHAAAYAVLLASSGVVPGNACPLSSLAALLIIRLSVSRCIVCATTSMYWTKKITRGEDVRQGVVRNT